MIRRESHIKGAAMRNLLLLVTGLTIGVSFYGHLLHAGAEPSPAEREVRAAEQQMHDAYVKHDVALFAKLYTEDATFTYSTGKVVGKAERVKDFTYPFTDLKDDLQKVRIYGEFAIVNDRSDYTAHSSPDHVAIQITRVWRKGPSGWRVVAFQSTPIR
jgi:uncharacterized protein (TIGR02246 family)